MKDSQANRMTGQILNAILNLGLAAVAIMLLVGFIRGRRVKYRNIKPSEIDSNVAAGEDLLRDALNEGHQGDAHHHGDDS
jgi:hypothetical protein